MANTNKTFCGPPPSYCNKTWNPSHCPVVRRSVKLSDWKAISKDENEIVSGAAAACRFGGQGALRHGALLPTAAGDHDLHAC